ncbi:DUF4304 domain-containing protein [Streptomyces sp. W16]|uniref:DUF4304 domain-containing protein n=1 Tax=Streptomyces sp. W16 TaxID=3076631 RepID=UPI00295BA615|nr:DUF4304 domain-containing protein [Streptomyces sp. W16]MDV9171629.1 DUF4304 domain-containing protein [Streptomyces sp. W16]
MTTAQKVLSEAVRTGISPELRKLGFAGSGQVFELANPGVWLLLGVQKATGGSASQLCFTVNVAAVPKGKWQEMIDAGAKYPARPSPNKVYGKWARWARIGQLMPGGQEFWWTVTDEAVPDELARKVVSACANYALPALKEQLQVNQYYSHVPNGLLGSL